MTPLVRMALELTPDEVEHARQRALDRNTIRAEVNLPTLPLNEAIAAASEETASEKRWIVYGYVKDRICRRYFGRIERMIEKRTGKRFRFNAVSGMAFQDRWLQTLDRFVEKELVRHYQGEPIPLRVLREVYDDGGAHSCAE